MAGNSSVNRDPPLRALISCCPGSGSTVFAHLLNAHPNLLSLHEMHIYRTNRIWRMRRFLSEDIFSRFPLSPNLLDKMWDADRSLVRKVCWLWAAYRGEHVMIRELLRHTAKERVDYVIDKVPNARIIGVYHRKYPDPKLIYLHRNPFGAVNSILRKTNIQIPGVNWGPRVPGATRHTARELLAARQYSLCLRRLRNAQEQGAIVHEVYYEDFVADPVRTYFGVFDFLNVEVSDQTRRQIVGMFSQFPLRQHRPDGWQRELTPAIKAEITPVLEADIELLPRRYVGALRTVGEKTM